MPQRQSTDSVRFSMGLEKENTMRFYIGVFEEEKDRRYWNKIVDYSFTNIFDRKFTFIQYFFPGTLVLNYLCLYYDK